VGSAFAFSNHERFTIAVMAALLDLLAQLHLNAALALALTVRDLVVGPKANTWVLDCAVADNKDASCSQ
jgi:hypothetical protein